MKLVHTAYPLEIALRENQINVLSIENPAAYSRILEDLWCQTNGQLGDFVLSEGEKIKNMAKEMVCVFNPFDLDCNEKKILTKLYQLLKEESDDRLFLEGSMLNSEIVRYLDHLIQFVPYHLDYTFDFDVIGLLKLYGLKIESSANSLLERIVDYLRALHQICRVHIVAFIGLKQYLSEKELQQLYEMVFYEKIHLIIIEAAHSKKIEGEKCWLVDQDLCIIEL